MKYYEITAVAGLGRGEKLVYNHHENKWIRPERHDGTGTTIDTREKAVIIYNGITDTDNISNMSIECVEVED